MKVTIEHSSQMRTVHQLANVKGRALLAMFPQYKRATVFKHAKKPINGEPVFDKRTHNKGRPRKLTHRDGRTVVRELLTLRVKEKSFCSPRVHLESGFGNVSNRTIRRTLHRLGYKYLRTRRKGMLLARDLPKRKKWCRYAKMITSRLPNFWTDNVSFYCDGVGFEYKTNPQDQARAPSAQEWRKECEGLSFNCTAKGKKEGVRQSHFIVGIAHRRGVVLCEQYFGTITGAKFADIVTRYFSLAFQKCKFPYMKHVLMDGCPRQGAIIARQAFNSIGASYMVVPPRSPDLNPIENLFNLVKRKIRQDAFEKNLTKENFEQFSERCKSILLSYSVAHIDATIESMKKRVNLVLYHRGQRIKY